MNIIRFFVLGVVGLFLVSMSLTLLATVATLYTIAGNLAILDTCLFAIVVGCAVFVSDKILI